MLSRRLGSISGPVAAPMRGRRPEDGERAVTPGRYKQPAYCAGWRDYGLSVVLGVFVVVFGEVKLLAGWLLVLLSSWSRYRWSKDCLTNTLHIGRIALLVRCRRVVANLLLRHGLLGTRGRHEAGAVNPATQRYGAMLQRGGGQGMARCSSACKHR
jgi:hypothetical protein